MGTEELAAEFGIAGVLDFATVGTGLVKAVVTLDGVAGELFLQGAQLTRWDPPGDHPRNRLPLAELLAHVRDCPARHKLLILDLTPPHEGPLFAPPAGALSSGGSGSFGGFSDGSGAPGAPGGGVN